MSQGVTQVSPQQKRLAVLVGIGCGIGVLGLLATQVYVTVTQTKWDGEVMSDQEVEANERVKQGIESIKDSVSGASQEAHEAWGVATQEMEVSNE